MGYEIIDIFGSLGLVEFSGEDKVIDYILGLVLVAL